MQDLARLAALVELERRNPQAFLVDVARAGADAVAADIGVMDGRADIGDDPVAVEDRGQHGDVEEVPGREPGIVGDQHVAGSDAVVEAADQVGAGERQRVDVAGRAGIGLRHHAAAPVEQRHREIAGFAHDRAEGDALQRLGALVDDADQVGPEDFELDAVHDDQSFGNPSGDDAADLVDRRRPARRDGGGGLAFLDDRRAGDGLPGRERLAVVDRASPRRRSTRERAARCSDVAGRIGKRRWRG